MPPDPLEIRKIIEDRRVLETLSRICDECPDCGHRWEFHEPAMHADYPPKCWVYTDYKVCNCHNRRPS